VPLQALQVFWVTVSPMFRSFWFYFNSIPVLFCILFFSINLLILWNSDYEAPAFNDAFIACKDVSNDKWADYERTYQDKCIDEFFGGKEDGIISIFEILWVWGLIFSIIGIPFIIPLSIYLLFTWRMNRYGHY